MSPLKTMFTQLRLSQRLALAFGLVLLLLCAVVGLAALQMARLEGHADRYAGKLVPSYEAGRDMTAALANLRRLQFQHVLDSTDAGKDAIEKQFQAQQKLLSDALARYETDLVADEADRKLIGAAQAAAKTFVGGWEPMRLASRAGLGDPTQTTKAQDLLQEAAKTYEAAAAAVQASWGYNLELARAATAQAQSTYNATRVGLLVLVVVAFALCLAVGVWTTRSITTPLRDAVRLTSAVAAGKLDVQVQAQGHDELADLLRSINGMVTGLSSIVQQVRSSSDSIATGSSQIATGNADLSQRTEQQASNLQQTAASMEQFSSVVRQSAETAGQAAELARSASDAATQGGRAVGDVVGTMQEIAAASRRIADIIGVIDGIAFQTNILALNAAVEAARAGEQGRGFAVVASEVRTLAQRSAGAAREIKSLIGASVEKVDLGSRQADAAGHAMSGIVEQVAKVSQLIADISGATREQSGGIQQVGHAVSELDRATQQNAALVEESAAAAESLKQQALSLTAVVARFQLRTDSA